MTKSIIKDNLITTDIDETYAVVAGSNHIEGNKWYSAANELVKSAKVLFDNHRISHCVYLLQQAVECTIKATFIDSGVSDVSLVKQIGHAPEKVFLSFYEKVGSSTYVDWCNEVIQDLNNSNIVSFQDKLTHFKSLINAIVRQFEQEKKESLYGHQIPTNAVTSLGFPPYIPSSMIHIYIARMKYVQNLLFCLSLIFKGTQENTRYPMEENNGEYSTPNQKYDKNVDLDDLGCILDFTDNVLGQINADRKYPFR